jgi:hypothetical protein
LRIGGLCALAQLKVGKLCDKMGSVGQPPAPHVFGAAGHATIELLDLQPDYVRDHSDVAVGIRDPGPESLLGRSTQSVKRL